MPGRAFSFTNRPLSIFFDLAFVTFPGAQPAAASAGLAALIFEPFLTLGTVQPVSPPPPLPRAVAAAVAVPAAVRLACDIRGVGGHVVVGVAGVDRREIVALGTTFEGASSAETTFTVSSIGG